MKYQVIEDNGGGLHLFVFRGRRVVFAGHDYEFNPGDLSKYDLPGLDAGDDTATWESSATPQADYANLTSHEYGWEIVADGRVGQQYKLYPDRMGRAAQIEFGVTED